MARLESGILRDILKETQASFPHGVCQTCECYLGLVAQLRVDASPESKKLLIGLMPAKNQIHTCLGCDPCLPGDRYTRYMRERLPSDLIILQDVRQKQ